MEKIAFLIMAHKNKAQVMRLCKTLQNERADVFLHFDRNINLNLDDFSESGVICTTRRLHGALFGASLIDIENLLLTTALEYGNTNKFEYKYFCLISGQDYPLQKIDDIIDKLIECYPKLLIDCTPKSESNWLRHRADYCSWYVKCNENIIPFANKQESIFLRKAIKAPIKISNIILSKFSSVSKTMKKNDLKLYGGSQWWILSDKAVTYIVSECINNTKKHKIVHSINGPDEVYFQTMLMNSMHMENIEVNPPEMTKQNCKTYANFNVNGKAIVGHPYVFTSDDIFFLRKLSEQGYYFARKFDSLVDENILDLIDKKILKG